MKISLVATLQDELQATIFWEAENFTKTAQLWPPSGKGNQIGIQRNL
jgi:hypothetical protein